MIDEILDQIKEHEVLITKIKEEAFKDEILIEKEISLEFDPKIKAFQLEITEKSKMIDELNNKIKEFEIQKRNEKNLLKDLKGEVQGLSKKKSKIFRKKLNDIDNDKTKRINIILKQIKILKKNLKMLEATKFADKWKKWSSFKREK